VVPTKRYAIYPEPVFMAIADGVRSGGRNHRGIKPAIMFHHYWWPPLGVNESENRKHHQGIDPLQTYDVALMPPIAEHYAQADNMEQTTKVCLVLFARGW